MQKFTVAVAGAMGAVGREMLKTLAQRDFPSSRVKALDIPENAGKKVPFGNAELTIETCEKQAFAGVDIALFAVNADVSRTLAPEAVEMGATVIDNSSAWRMDENVPLVVPECNPADLVRHKGIIANPNCSTIIALVPLKPLHDYANIKRIVVSTYQAVSGAGMKGIEELTQQARSLIEGKSIQPAAFTHQIAFNLIPHIDYFEENGYTHEEMKMVRESRRILNMPDLPVSCTCVRVPVYRSHSEAITIETERELTPEKARDLLRKTPGVKLYDNPSKNEYPMPVDTSGGDLVWVGRVRKDISAENALVFWCAGDQLRKGAALNAVQIAEKLIEMELI